MTRSPRRCCFWPLWRDSRPLAGFCPSRHGAAWAEGRFDVLTTVDVLTEYRRVGDRLAKQYPSIRVDPILDLIIRECRNVAPFPVAGEACNGEDDVKFLGCAISGQAICVLSGDRALLRATGYEGIEVLTPRSFEKRFLEV